MRGIKVRPYELLGLCLCLWIQAKICWNFSPFGVSFRDSITDSYFAEPIIRKSLIINKSLVFKVGSYSLPVQRVVRGLGSLLRLSDMTAAEDTARAAFLSPQTPSDTPALGHSTAMSLISSYFFIIYLSVSYGQCKTVKEHAKKFISSCPTYNAD